MQNNEDIKPEGLPIAADRTPHRIRVPKTCFEVLLRTHFYVAEELDIIIGCGAIGPYWGKKDEISLFTVFVLPEYQRKGVGRTIIETLERDEFFLRAKRIEIPASITGVPFYLKWDMTIRTISTSQMKSV